MVKVLGLPEGLSVLRVCSLVASHLLVSLYFFCFTSLQSEPPVMPTNWPSLHTEVDWLIYFHCQHSSESSSYIWSWHRTSSCSTIWHTKHNCSQIFSVLCHWLLFSIEGLWNEAGATAHLYRKYSSGWILSSEELCCSTVPYPPPLTRYAVLKMCSFLIKKRDAPWKIWG